MTEVVRPIFSSKNAGIKFLRNLQKDHLNFFVNMMRREGDFCAYKILNNKVVLLNDATALKYIFSENYKNYHKSKYNDVLKPVLGGGIFLSEDEAWWSQRQEAAPIFAGGNFPEMTGQMVDAAEAMFKKWDDKILHNEPIDIQAETMRFALDVALRTFFHQQREEIANGVQDNLGTMLREAETRIWSFLTLPQKWVLKLPKYKKSLGYLNEIVTELIEERRRTGIYPDDLLTRAIKSCDGGPSARMILQDKIMSYLTSAHETTANAMAWTWFELSQRPEVLRKMTAEVDEKVGNDKPDYESIKSLHYTCNVFDEAMRLYPPVWTMSREALNDDYVPLDSGQKLHIEKGTVLMLSPYVVHRREKYWTNPVGFDPDRFKAEEVSQRPKFSYFPFGGGARLCLGFKFAQIEAAVIMAMMVQRYKLSLIPGQRIQPVPMITLRSTQPIWFDVKHRNDVAEHFVSSEIEQRAVCPYQKIKMAS